VTYTDKTLTCSDCGASFTFSADDQEFFALKGYSQPKRCPSCRQARKAERGGGGGGGGYGSRSDWCRSNYRSYDPRTGYYRAYSGRLVYCG